MGDTSLPFVEEGWAAMLTCIGGGLAKVVTQIAFGSAVRGADALSRSACLSARKCLVELGRSARGSLMKREADVRRWANEWNWIHGHLRWLF